MDLNFTLIGQMITFLVLVLVTMKWIWPPLTKVLEKRREQIAEGIADAEKAKRELELARKKSKELIQEAKAQAAVVVEQANVRAHNIEETAHEEARVAAERTKAQAKTDVAQMHEEARRQLVEEAVNMAVDGAEKILGKNIDRAANNDLLAQLANDLK